MPRDATAVYIADLLIAARRPLTRDDVEALAGLGLRLVERVGDDTYRFRGPTEADVADVRGLDFVASVDLRRGHRSDRP